MSKVLYKNLQLVYASAENPLVDMLDQDLKDTLKKAIAANDMEIMVNATNLYTQSFLDIEYKPSWLNSEFESEEWEIIFSKGHRVLQSSAMTIVWNEIRLDDGSFLTDIQHEQLLNTFKRWLVNIDHPNINGGRLAVLETSKSRLYDLLKLLECIILNGKAIRLSEMHLSLMNLDFLIDTLVSILTFDEYGIPKYLQFKERARRELLQASAIYSSNEKRECIQNVFNFSQDEYKRVNNFLFDVCITNNIFDSNKFRKILCKNNLFSMMKKTNFVDGIVQEAYKPKERFYGLYRTSETTATKTSLMNDGEVGRLNLGGFIKLFKQLSFSANQEAIQLDQTIFSQLNFNTVARVLDIARGGRFKTLPVRPILNLMRDAFEFAFNNIDAILQSVIDIFEFQMNRRSLGKALNECDRRQFSSLVNQLYPKKICCGDYLSGSVDVDKRKISLHSDTVINKFNILISSVQFLFSVFSAKRTSEIDNLKPYSNLVPNIHPDDADYNILFSVESLIMKTGVGGPKGIRAVTRRPMIRSVARLVWKIEDFNKEIMQMGIELSSLFNLLTSSEKQLLFGRKSVISPYKYICEYFDTPYINENGVPKKLYFSNHQLRRFFAMMFFWANGYDGLDSIRWMLGHSSSEHLYHYITESCNGAVLNGIKASHLVNEVQNGQLETIDVLRKAISQYYDVEQANIEIERISDAVRDYIDDEDYETNPSKINDADLIAIEDTLYKLLHNDIIRLEPTFFTVERDGVSVQDYRMILEVRELY